MKQSKRERLHILRKLYSNLNNDIVKILDASKDNSDLFYGLALDLRFVILEELGRLDNWKKLPTFLISNRKIEEWQKSYRHVNSTLAMLDKEYYRWKRTGSLKEKEEELDIKEVDKK